MKKCIRFRKILFNLFELADNITFFHFYRRLSISHYSEQAEAKGPPEKLGS